MGFDRNELPAVVLEPGSRLPRNLGDGFIFVEAQPHVKYCAIRLHSFGKPPRGVQTSPPNVEKFTH